MYQDRSGGDAHLLHHQLAETNPDAVWMYTPDWSTLRFSTDAYEAIWGRPVESLVEDPTAFLDGVHPDDRDRVREAMASLSNETPVELEFRVRDARDHELRDVWFEGRPVYDEDGTFAVITCYARDVTELKRYQRRLQGANERLEALNRFLSHDIKNQLQMAMGYLEIAMEAHPDEALDHVDRALDRMNQMTDDILALPRPDADAVDRVGVSVDALAERCWAAVDSAGATLVVEDDATIHVDEGLFQNVLENLFRNVVVHNDGPVTARVGSLPDGDGLYVEDDGVGIPAEAREQVFEFGYSTGGNGLGLALVREIVDLHGGTVSVGESDAGGARFEITGIEPPGG